MFFINGKVEGENKNESKENKDEDVRNVNLNVDLEEVESINNITPRHKKNSSNMSGSSLSTTVSKNRCINDGPNGDGKEVFDCAGNSFFAKRDLISSFKFVQEAGDDSDDEKELLIHNNKGVQQKRKKNEYFDLITEKIKKQDDQKGTFSLVREKKDSSIFVPRHAFIGNNKISQEVGDKKDVHKYLHILPKNNSGQLVRKDKRNNAEKLRKYKLIEKTDL